MSSITVRNVLTTELTLVIDLEHNVWLPALQANEYKLLSRLKEFPEGFFGAFDEDGKLIGTCTSMIIDKPEEDNNITWNTISNDGCAGNHKSGTDLYVVSLGVSRNFQNKGVGSLLLKSQIELAKIRGLAKVIVGARCPGYHQYKDEPISNYISRVTNNFEKQDPGVRFYERNGFKIHKIIPGFMPGDMESCEYGIVMIHEC